MSGRATAETIAAALGVSRSTIHRRAATEAWLYKSEPVRGGHQALYNILTLPGVVRDQVTAYLASREAHISAAVASGRAAAGRIRLVRDVEERSTAAARQAGLAAFGQLPERRQQRAEARAALVKLADHYVEVSGLAKREAIKKFAADYSAGTIDVPQSLRDAIPRVCANSIENWRQALDRDGLARLAGKHGEHRRGTGTIDATPGMRELVLGMLVEFPHCGADHVMRAIRARFESDLHPSYRSVQRWIATWKAQNKQLFEAVTNPDAWRSKYKAAGGNAAASILRLNQRWELDSTKADLLLNDGQRHVIVGCIDVYSRRLKLHVSRSSSSAAVAAVLRHALLDWGVPEQAGTDNGSDYVSNHITRVLAGLAIDHDTAPPYTPDHKGFIERVFGTFCRDLVELLPGYSGHNVAERKAIEARRSFAQRMMDKNSKVELRMSAEELQKFCDDWTDQVYGIEPHSSLDGRSPFQVAAAWSEPVSRITDERALDVLLAPAPGSDGLRTITKKGIRLDRALFEAPELGGLEGQQVRVLLDEADIGEIYVFSLDGAFVVKAVCPERTGVSRKELAAARKAHQHKTMKDQKAALKATAQSAGTATILNDIRRERAEEAGKLVAFPPRATEHTTPDLAQAAAAARADRAEAAPVPAAVARRREAIAAELTAPAQVVPMQSAEALFTRALDLEAHIAAGHAVTDADREWLGRYQRTPAYRTRKKILATSGPAILTA